MKKKTIFCDIDGTLLKYREFEKYSEIEPIPILSVVNKINVLYSKGHHIVITTARSESMRKFTINELKKCNILYNQLVMGIGRGNRFLINDKIENTENRATGINVIRDKGFTLRDLELLD